MIHLELKTKTPIGVKKFYYARVIASILSEIKWFKMILKRIDSEVEIDYKIKLK